MPCEHCGGAGILIVPVGQPLGWDSEPRGIIRTREVPCYYCRAGDMIDAFKQAGRAAEEFGHNIGKVGLAALALQRHFPDPEEQCALCNEDIQGIELGPWHWSDEHRGFVHDTCEKEYAAIVRGEDVGKGGLHPL